MYNPHIKDMYCTTERFNISQLYIERNAIDENPTYQRESAIWSPEKQELFIDSLINGYDVPKIYFHDLRGKGGNKKFAIIDGKQRLDTIYRFLESKFALASDFKIATETEYVKPAPGMLFENFSEVDKERFRGIGLSVVLVHNAAEDDIEDLFFRLNNGEPLNAAEKRNARGGKMNELIKEICKEPFFSKKIRFDNKRFAHFEIGAKILLLEKTEMDSTELFSDLKKKFLDNLVINNKNMTEAVKDGLLARAKKQLDITSKVFSDKDPLLSKQAYPPLYYVFLKIMNKEYGHSHLHSLLKKFLESFEAKRQENLLLNEDKVDPLLIEFGRLMQQGTNDINSLKNRTSILRRYFLLDNPDVKLLDKKRQFTPEERYAIWILSGKQCSECQKELKDIKEMDADHVDQHIFGGETTLKNARALCPDCNIKLKQNRK